MLAGAGAGAGAGAVVCEALPGDTGAPGGKAGAPAGAAVVAGCVLGGAPGGNAGLPAEDGCAGAAAAPGAGFGVAGVVPAGAFSGPRPQATLQASAASTSTSGSDRRGIGV